MYKLKKVTRNDFVPVTVNDTLTSTSTTDALSANQGKVLKDYVDAINDLIDSNDMDLDTLQEIVDFIKLNKSLFDTKVDKVSGKQLSSNDFTDQEKTKLSSLFNTIINDTLTSTSVTEALSANQGKVLNDKITTILAKLFSNDSSIQGLQDAIDYMKQNRVLIDTKVDKVTGKGLSTNDFDDAYKAKLDSLFNTTINDTLVSTSTTKALSANQGKVLKGFVDTNSTKIQENFLDISSILTKISSNDTSLSTFQQLVDAIKSNTNDINTKVDKVTGKELSSNDFTDAYKTKLDSLANTVIEDVLTSVSTDKALSANQGRVLKGMIDNLNTLVNSNDVNLDTLQEIVDFIKLNRSDLDALSISSIAGLQNALDDLAREIRVNTNGITALGTNKVDKVTGKDLSTNDFDDAYKTKLDSLENTNIVDTLTSTSTTDALSANQGKVLDGKISANTVLINTKEDALPVYSGPAGSIDKYFLGADKLWHPNPTVDLSSYVPYSGANNNVLLGANDLNVGVDLSSGATGQSARLVQTNSHLSVTNIGSVSKNTKVFSDSIYFNQGPVGSPYTKITRLEPYTNADYNCTVTLPSVSGQLLSKTDVKNNFTSTNSDVPASALKTKETWDRLNKFVDYNSLDVNQNSMKIESAVYPTHRGSLSATTTNFSSVRGLCISQGASESSGIKMDGDGITMWSPVDTWYLKILDEDSSGSSYFLVNTTGGISTSSDMKLKDNLISLEDFDLSKLNKIRVGFFDRKVFLEKLNKLKKEKLEDEEKFNKDKAKVKKLNRLQKKVTEFGLIANDVKEVFPHAVSKDGNDNLIINKDAINFSLIKVVQQLNNIVDKQQKAIDKLTEKIFSEENKKVQIKVPKRKRGKRGSRRR